MSKLMKLKRGYGGEYLGLIEGDTRKSRLWLRRRFVAGDHAVTPHLTCSIPKSSTILRYVIMYYNIQNCIRI